MEDSQLQQITGITVAKKMVEILLYRSYKGFLPEKIDEQIVSNQLLNRKFVITKRTEDQITIKTQGGVIITLIHSCCKKWIKVGTFTNITQILLQYPSTEYEYGSQNNTRLVIQNINITGWNRGIRIYFPLMQPHGDNATTFHMGTSLYTKGTDDEESKQSKGFTHRYVNSNFVPCCGCVWKNCQLPVYVRKL